MSRVVKPKRKIRVRVIPQTPEQIRQKSRNYNRYLKGRKQRVMSEMTDKVVRSIDQHPRLCAADHQSFLSDGRKTVSVGIPYRTDSLVRGLREIFGLPKQGGKGHEGNQL